MLKLIITNLNRKYGITIMRILIQRVSKASVKVEEKVVGNIKKGLLVFLGITHEDEKEDVDYLVKKLCNLRIFKDENNKMNLSIKNIEGELLIVSQFTLYADSSSGNRPNFILAANANKAENLYEYFIKKCKQNNINTETGIFGASMQVELINDGPVTILLESK